jgi:hypothetical protein
MSYKLYHRRDRHQSNKKRRTGGIRIGHRNVGWNKLDSLVAEPKYLLFFDVTC